VIVNEQLLKFTTARFY